MSFSVHNTYLHMTNVNTIEDKNITHPPVIMILAFCCCVATEAAGLHACVRVCTCAFLCTSMFEPRVSEQKNKDSIWSEPQNVPVWNTSTILRSLFDAAQRWSGARLKAARGLIWFGLSRWKPELRPVSPLQWSCATRTRGDGLIHPSLPSPLLHSDSM